MKNCSKSKKDKVLDILIAIMFALAFISMGLVLFGKGDMDDAIIMLLLAHTMYNDVNIERLKKYLEKK